MLKTLKNYLILALTFWAVVLLPMQAEARILGCHDNGTVVDTTELFYDGYDPNNPGAPSNPNSFCGHTGSTRIFSNVLCNYVIILNEVLGRVYCGMQHTLADYVAIVLTIYVILFGVQILMGTTKLNSTEMVMRLIKIGLVWMFVGNANWAVNYLFTFFIDFANQGIWWTLGSLRDGGGQYFSTVIDMPDYTANVSGTTPVYVYIDDLIYSAISGPFVQTNAKVMILFAGLSYMFPPIFMIAAYWLWTTFTIFARTLISFVMSLSAIAFLICLSPIFFCFILFQPTINFFETWLKYMMSFSLQVIIVFACVALWIMAMSNFVGFFNQLSNVIFTDVNLNRLNAVVVDSKSIGICPYIVTTGNTANATTLRGPNVKCANPAFDPYAKMPDPLNPDNVIPTPEALADQARLINLGKQDPAQSGGASSSGANPACGTNSQLPAGATQCTLTRLNYYMIYHLITLIIIAYTFDALLKKAPYIAKELAGPQYVPILGQGFGGLGYHGVRGAAKNVEKQKAGANYSESDTAQQIRDRLIGKRQSIGDTNPATDS